MPEPNYVLLYVKNPPASAEFYGELLGKTPIQNAPTFALFVLDSGNKLGLWLREDVKPDVPSAPSVFGGEIAFLVEDVETVDKTYADWKQRGLTIVQELTDLDFGHTFVALDPDENRLRVFALSM